MTLAIVKVLPEPVTPNRVCSERQELKREELMRRLGEDRYARNDIAWERNVMGAEPSGRPEITRE